MMRNGQNKRMRGRNRNNNNNNNHNRGHHHNPLTRVYESNGPDVKIRGTAHHIAEKYLQLARDATSVGDHVTAEAHYQHAEHYFRLIAAAQEQFRQQNPHYQPQPVQQQAGDDRDELSDDDSPSQPAPIPQNFGGQQSLQPREQPQPYATHQPQPYSAPQPMRPQPPPQPYQQQPQQPSQAQPPQQAQPNFGGDEVGGLPSFITGAQPQQAPQYGANGHDSQGERFPMHRRRRRHRGPHNPQQPQDVRGEAPEAPGNE